MGRVPTDLRILTAIHDRYYDEFSAYSETNKIRASKVYVPIDVATIAKDLETDGDIVFGRLYYHMQQRYGYIQRDGSDVPFFYLKLGDDRHCIHFPLLSAVLADLAENDRRFRIATWIAVVALVVSVIALVVSTVA